ncbi:hypothetical protein BSLG_003607 [Batrachochytrium salamandrivorans]|nr:hypothetical protein BSLG_003607 [Batrachochytrium salamandrivorans]
MICRACRIALYAVPLRTPEPLLAIDGYDTDWSRPSFVQRMWAGGDIRWMPHSPLCVGETVTRLPHAGCSAEAHWQRGHAMFEHCEDISNQAGHLIHYDHNYASIKGRLRRMSGPWPNDILAIAGSLPPQRPKQDHSQIYLSCHQCRLCGQPLTLHGQWAVQSVTAKLTANYGLQTKGNIAMKGTLEFE